MLIHQIAPSPPPSQGFADFSRKKERLLIRLSDLFNFKIIVDKLLKPVIVITMKLELATLLAKDIPPFVIKWAKEWLMELGSDAQEQEDIADFVDNATDAMIIRETDRLWDGGWVDHERTARLDEKARIEHENKSK
tara:strand:+ start:785 stop:1192 length:408 start_codon:yes stop_codon:yes gene_type:complete